MLCFFFFFLPPTFKEKNWKEASLFQFLFCFPKGVSVSDSVFGEVVGGRDWSGRRTRCWGGGAIQEKSSNEVGSKISDMAFVSGENNGSRQRTVLVRRQEGGGCVES